MSRDLVRDETVVAKNLLPHKIYEFRVNAVNAAGSSPWSDNSELIEACNPVGKCGILLDTKLVISSFLSE